MNLKRVILSIVCSLTVIASVANMSSTIFAGGIDTTSGSDLTEEQMLQELQPYQVIIDKINADYGSSIQIPDGGVEKVYKNVIGTDFDQFEQDLRRRYKEALVVASRANTLAEVSSETTAGGPWIEGDSITEISEDEANFSGGMNTRSIREEIRQTRNVDRGKVFMDSVIFSATGNTGSFTYERFIRTGHVTSPTENYFAVSKYSYSMSSDRKSITIKYTGALMTPSGLTLTVSMKPTVVYGAND